VIRVRVPLAVAALLSLIAFIPPVSAQQFRIDAWTADDGLPQNPVNRVLQTRDGFLWLATYAGLVRYDGARFEVFNTGTTPSLNASRFANLFEDRDGNLWAATEGQGLVRYRDGRFYRYFGPGEGLTDNSSYQFMTDASGRMILDSPDGAVVWNGERLVPYTGPNPTNASGKIRVMHRHPSGSIWYLAGSVLHKFDHGAVTRSVPVPFPSVRWLFEDASGAVWIEIAEGPAMTRSLLRWENGAFRRFTAADGIPSFRTMTAGDTRDGAVWFGLRAGGGLLRYKDGAFTRFTTADGLPSNDVGQVTEDREGTLWVATEGGLARITQRVVTPHTTADGLAADNTYPIFEDRDGSLLIGGWNGLTHHANGRFQSVGEKYGVADKNVMAIFRDRDEALWLGTWGWGGLRRIGRSGAVEAFGELAAGDVVRVVAQDASGTIWLGGNSGLTWFRDGKFKRVTAAHGFSGGTVLNITTTRDGTMWIGTDQGVSAYRQGVFSNYSAAAGLTGASVRAIYEDADGVLWFGTYDNGLFRYEQGVFRRFSTREGLFDNGVFHILEDARGNLWMSSNAGIYRVARRELNAVATGQARTVNSVPYGRRDGMMTAECNGGGQPSGMRTRDGRLWFPTQKGVVVIDADHLPINTEPPPVAITQVRVDQQTVALAGSLRVLPDQTAFEIEYAGLTFQRPELTRFRYRLEGLDPDWIDVGRRRAAYFSHVPPGSYRFVVIAANRDGTWNETGASLPIVVVPPIYRTRWFQSLLALLVVALAYGVHRRRIGAIKQEQALHDAYARRLIDAQEQDRKRIAGEIHDSLSQNLVMISNWARQATTSTRDDSTREALGDISTTASTALREVQEIAYNLGPYQLDRLGFKRTVETLLTRATSASRIAFAPDLVDLAGAVAKDVEVNVFRMIQESVNNVIKHSGATEATVRVARTDDALTVVVQDNGRGFALAPPAAAPTGRGFGLVGLAERARILGGTFAIDSAPGFGTRIDISLPLTAQQGADAAADSNRPR
jgi:ligand-binding sensor domain-containing protein/signal transduction histidine kinase